MPSSFTASQGPQQPPIAYAVPYGLPPVANQELTKLTSPFVGRTIGQLYQGPGWVNDHGVACIVVMAADDKTPARVRSGGGCAFIAWRWNNTPSVPFSLTLMTKEGSPRPHARWIRSSDDEVVAAIRREGRFLVAIANAKGRNSGWFEASFHRSEGANGPSTEKLEALWEFETPGIPYSNTSTRFDPLRRTSFNEGNADEIPLWPEPQSDYWSMLNYSGPWDADLHARDKALAAWGRQAYVWRGRAAGFVQMVIERQQLDGVAPLVDEAGAWARDDEFRERALVMVARAPTLGDWLAAMVGPKPDAKAAYDAAFRTLHTAYDLFCLLDKMFELLGDLGDWVLTEAVQANLEAVLLDARVTHGGTQRPWLANVEGGYGIAIRSSPFDLDASLVDIERTWVSGLQLMGLFDLGLRIGPNDFLAPLDAVCDTFSNLTLEGSIEDAEAKVQSLLAEAQEARQWSIPWGARVEVNFGPFTSVKIFEAGGEFSCHFLDDQDRYFLVAVGLQNQPPKASCSHLIRHRSDDGEPVWNSDAEASLMLIAAAIVRDFIVVEERGSLFTSRSLRRRIRGRDVRSVIYLPRVRYSTPRPDRMPLGDASAGRAKHQVAPHLRKATQASAAQRFLAQRYGVHLPEGFTFVRPHERGAASDTERMRVYRSRSASRMIFDEVATAPEGTRPAWFDFEKDCARLLTARGMKVIHQAAHRDGDGGVDLFAIDRDDVSWVVQCKCWAVHRPVGPGVVRELAGAIASADRGKASPSRGMIITTSRLTPGAASEAAALGFEVVQGGALAVALN